MKLRVFSKEDEERFSRSMATGADEQLFINQILSRLDQKPDRRTEGGILVSVGVLAAVGTTAIMASSGAFRDSGKVGGLVWMFGTLIPVAIVQAYYRARFAHHWDNTNCRSCGYSLAEIPSERRVVVNGTPRQLGPSACPECGQRWPLIFPQ